MNTVLMEWLNISKTTKIPKISGVIMSTQQFIFRPIIGRIIPPIKNGLKFNHSGGISSKFLVKTIFWANILQFSGTKTICFLVPPDWPSYLQKLALRRPLSPVRQSLAEIHSKEHTHFSNTHQCFFLSFYYFLLSTYNCHTIARNDIARNRKLDIARNEK
jgi:hypothetical protein